MTEFEQIINSKKENDILSGFIEKILDYIKPTHLFYNSGLRSLWKQEQRRSYFISSKKITIIIAIIVLSHLFVIDLPNNLSPLSFWVSYRVGVAAYFLIVYYLVISQKISSLKVLKSLIFGGILITTFLLFISMTIDPNVGLTFFILACSIGSILLDFSLIPSAGSFCVFYFAPFAFYSNFLLSAGKPPAVLTSGFITGLFIVFLFRTNYIDKVRLFILEKNELKTKGEIIEAQKSLVEQVKSFLAPEHYRRILDTKTKQKMSITEAVDEVMRLRETEIVAIWSDIRGFTEGSKDLIGYIKESAIPNIRHMTTIASVNRGIPRIVGDLILTYFDFGSRGEKVCSALNVASKIIDENKRLNKKHQNQRPISRQILVSFGKAITGNIGGASETREITALGSPINILSRVDSIAKNIGVNYEAIITTQAFHQATLDIGINLKFEKVELLDFNIKIKDFEEETSLYIVAMTKENKETIKTLNAPHMSKV